MNLGRALIFAGFVLVSLGVGDIASEQNEFSTWTLAGRHHLAW